MAVPYVGSVTTVDLPPSLGPRVASACACDAPVATTAYEIGQVGIETTIVMPGGFTTGATHAPRGRRGRARPPAPNSAAA